MIGQVLYDADGNTFEGEVQVQKVPTEAKIFLIIFFLN